MANEPLTKKDKEKILRRAQDEYAHALKYRHKREDSWNDIDDLYYGNKRESLVTRANVHIPKMQGTIETFLSKVDQSPYINYGHKKTAERPQANRMNSLISDQRKNDDWDLIDTAGKKEGALYGRTIFKKYSTSENGFTDYFSLVDSIDALIDPLAGGLKPYQEAQYCGEDNIIKSVYEMKDKEKYDQEAVKAITHALESDDEVDNEYNSHRNRRSALGLSDAVLINDESVRLVEWYTTYHGERVYILFSPGFNKAVRCEKLKEVLGFDHFPFASWAPFLRAHEFWTPGLADLLIEPNRVQNIILSQLLDNNAYLNYGMKVYDKSKILNPEHLTPRPGGRVPVNGNPRDAVMNLDQPSIQNGVQMYRMVEDIFAQETGMTGQTKGMPNSKRMSATEFSGLLDEVADRFFTANKTYKHAMRRIAKLYHAGVEAHMTKPKKVQLLGARSGSQEEEIKGDKVSVDDGFNIVVDTGPQAESNDNMLRDRFAEFFNAAIESGIPNKEFLIEKFAQVMGLEPDEIDRMMSEEEDSNWQILSEAEQENEVLLRKEIEPNRAATAAHIQRHLDFARTTSDLTDEQRERIVKHARSEVEFARKNMQLESRRLMQQKRRNAIQEGGTPMGANSNQGASPQQQAQQQAPLPQPPEPAGPAQNAPAKSVPEQVRMDAIRSAPPNA